MTMEIIQQYSAGDAIVTLGRSRDPLCADVNDMREAIRRHEFLRDIDTKLRRARERRDIQAVSPSPGFVVNTGGSAIALAAATAKTVMYVNAGTNYEPTLVEWCISFDGVTASAVPVLVELCYGTKASNSTPGTASTAFTPLQARSWAAKTATCTAANTCTSEPTVLTSHRQYLITPNGGVILVQYPLNREPTGTVTASTSGLQLAIRLTAPAIVNARGFLEFEE